MQAARRRLTPRWPSATTSKPKPVGGQAIDPHYLPLPAKKIKASTRTLNAADPRPENLRDATANSTAALRTKRSHRKKPGQSSIWAARVVASVGVERITGGSPDVIKRSLTRVAAAVGGLALSLTAGVGIASAAPDLGPIVNTTCSYPQVMSALNAQDSAVAAQFSSSPMNTSALQQFLASPPAARQQMATMIANQPGNEQYYGLIQQVFNTCNSF